MADTDEPAWGTVEYHLIGLQRVASSIEDGPQAEAYLSATVSFIGDSDMVGEAEVLQRAADYFRAHPELTVQTANWTRFEGSDGYPRFALELGVLPPASPLTTEQVRQFYPNAPR
ncbi:hypothetical protein [Nocardia sp. CA-120079]|uniref:hypothetical protein n=1 Tax=Nocardia sp. CA-120079 TaxID=3239974 RepID=UPI003D976FEA